MSASSCQVLTREAEFSVGVIFPGMTSSFLRESKLRPVAQRVALESGQTILPARPNRFACPCFFPKPVRRSLCTRREAGFSIVLTRLESY
jgi:hypothetical protein